MLHWQLLAETHVPLPLQTFDEVDETPLQVKPVGAGAVWQYVPVYPLLQVQTFWAVHVPLPLHTFEAVDEIPLHVWGAGAVPAI